ncbi:hypothetical protein [Ornithinibacillus xuwenensis]|uniref:Uncharacterized protein n=1 Tax=Ornithinibacillus xuwenensis TaxID=3144668 RepID=A0ABU9XG90_9BACI
MGKKTRAIIALIGSVMICLFGLYRLLFELPSAAVLVMVPIVFVLTGGIGIVGNNVLLKKLYRSH